MPERSENCFTLLDILWDTLGS